MKSKRCLVVRGGSGWTVFVAREVVEQTLIELPKLGAFKFIKKRREERSQEGRRVVDICQRSLQEMRNSLLQKNESEACKVVTFKQVFGIQHPPSEVLNVDTSK